MDGNSSNRQSDAHSLLQISDPDASLDASPQGYKSDKE
ncbi:hypothetical protein DDI_1393 [Dickeya dianthicola RNS04.9]|nr:hypothetical protein DDI_1393 [Dickeya dianthicola RNS04.9]